MKQLHGLLPSGAAMRIEPPVTCLQRWSAICSFRSRTKRQTKELGREPKSDDYVFLPLAASPDFAMKLPAKQFESVLDVTKLKMSIAGETHSLYSLRHSCIMYRLMFGFGIDALTLTRNARTNPEMIDPFYAAPFQGEINVEMLQSKRRSRPRELQQAQI